MPVLMFRDRTELIMPARLIYGIVKSDAVVTTDASGVADLERCQKFIVQACVEPLEGLPKSTALIVTKQIDRLATKIYESFGKISADKMAAAVYYFIKDITDSEYLVLYEGSAFAEAAQIFYTMIEHVFEDVKRDESAQKRARQLMQRLQAEGLYK